MGKSTKENRVSKKTGGKKSEKVESKSGHKNSDANKSKNKRKGTDVPKNATDNKKNIKSNAKNVEKQGHSRKSIHKESAKNENSSKKKVQLNNNDAVEKPFFLCFCCGGNENEELNEMLLEQERRREEAAHRKAEEEKKRKEEAEKKRKEEEEKKHTVKIVEEKEADEEEEAKQTSEQKKNFLKKFVTKAKVTQKKAQINFTGFASAPPPPPASACEGNPPKVKPTSVNLSEGAYLMYKNENGGQLEINYSKQAIHENGVLAYIAADSIPPFYFTKNNGKEVLLKDVSKLLQSEFVRDRISYYDKWNDFLKLKKTFNGTLYLLPAFNANPPATIDIMFFSSQQAKLQFAPIEKPVEMWGDYVFIIQRGLEIFHKEKNADALLAYVNSFGLVAYN